jgi:hypothetical protein
MNTAKLLNDIEQLPPEAQQKIEEIVGLMKDYYLSSEKKPKPSITKGDKTINPSELFGLWKDQPRNLTDIRKQAWQQVSHMKFYEI